jgi:superfamily II DNA or RNA helicase
LILAEVFAREPDGRALVICPAALREQWQRELAVRFDLLATVLDSAGAARTASAHGFALSPWAAARIVITSIDYVKRPEVMRALEPLVWDVIVFDEAHGLAGPSDRATAAALLGTRARRVVLLTATPHSGDDDAFSRICDVGRLDSDGPLLMFRRTRAEAGISATRRTAILKVRLSEAEAAMHEALVAYARRVWQQSPGAHPGAKLAMAVLLRRAYSSAASLARSIERRRTLLAQASLDGAQLVLPFVEAGADDDEPAAILAARGLIDPLDEDRTLERLLRLARRAANGQSKVAVLVRLLRRVREPLLIFTEYRDTLNDLVSQLPIPVVSMHGGMTATERRSAAREFTDGTASVLVATDAASEGLNLHQRCRVVVNLELPWTPLRLEQRVGRVDRIGQARSVHALHLVARGTGEESIVARLSAREARARSSLEQIANAIIRDVMPVALDLKASALPEAARVVTVDLRTDAEAEAERLRTARALAEKESRRTGPFGPASIAGSPKKQRRFRPVSDAMSRDHIACAAKKTRPTENDFFSSRPAICLVRSRVPRPSMRLWTWRLTFTDDAGRLIWEALLPIQAAGVPGPGSPAWVRACLPDHAPGLDAVLKWAEETALADLATEMQDRVALLIRREQAIAAALEKRHARLAANLLQPGLFDKRSDRAAQAHAALLDEARSRTAARLAALEASGKPVMEACSLVFAVALR